MWSPLYIMSSVRSEVYPHSSVHCQEYHGNDKQSQVLDVDTDVAAEGDVGRPPCMVVVSLSVGIDSLQCVYVCVHVVCVCWRYKFHLASPDHLRRRCQGNVA